VADVNEKAAQAVVENITAKGQAAIAVKCDVSRAEQVKAMVDRDRRSVWKTGRNI
jgi:NAD(P)-dependent dehydrogenase (short-subunit alcohol dehydrogenase family)